MHDAPDARWASAVCEYWISYTYSVSINLFTWLLFTFRRLNSPRAEQNVSKDRPREREGEAEREKVHSYICLRELWMRDGMEARKTHIEWESITSSGYVCVSLCMYFCECRNIRVLSAPCVSNNSSIFTFSFIESVHSACVCESAFNEFCVCGPTSRCFDTMNSIFFFSWTLLLHFILSPNRFTPFTSHTINSYFVLLCRLSNKFDFFSSVCSLRLCLPEPVKTPFWKNERNICELEFILFHISLTPFCGTCSDHIASHRTPVFTLFIFFVRLTRFHVLHVWLRCSVCFVDLFYFLILFILPVYSLCLCLRYKCTFVCRETWRDNLHRMKICFFLHQKNSFAAAAVDVVVVVVFRVS